MRVTLYRLRLFGNLEGLNEQLDKAKLLNDRDQLAKLSHELDKLHHVDKLLSGVFRSNNAQNLNHAQKVGDASRHVANGGANS